MDAVEEADDSHFLAKEVVSGDPNSLEEAWNHIVVEKGINGGKP